MKARFYVEWYLNGWEDAGWQEDDKPLRFATAADASAAVDEFFRDVKDAVACGYMAAEYDRMDYRVAKESVS